MANWIPHGLPSCQVDFCAKSTWAALGTEHVTELPRIIPHYRLSLSTWLLSNNNELFCCHCRDMPGESLTTGSLICANPTRRLDQNTSSTLHKSPQVQLITNQVFNIKVKVIQSLNNGNKTSGRYTWEAIHRV
jgi:hypothetical protein